MMGQQDTVTVEDRPQDVEGSDEDSDEDGREALREGLQASFDRRSGGLGPRRAR